MSKTAKIYQKDNTSKLFKFRHGIISLAVSTPQGERCCYNNIEKVGASIKKRVFFFNNNCLFSWKTLVVNNKQEYMYTKISAQNWNFRSKNWKFQNLESFFK